MNGRGPLTPYKTNYCTRLRLLSHCFVEENLLLVSSFRKEKPKVLSTYASSGNGRMYRVYRAIIIHVLAHIQR